MPVKDLTQLYPGEIGVVVSLGGGRGFVNRLANLGIRPGKRVVKISAQLWAGPVIVAVEGRQVALGFGRAKKILVEVLSEANSSYG